MGPVTRCVGPWVPPSQPFQHALPPAPTSLPDFAAVSAAITAAFSTLNPALPPDTSGGAPDYSAVLVHLAWQCASTFRGTDYSGGCNGARIRFLPGSAWSTNIAMDKAMSLLLPIFKQFSPNGLTWADLIVLAGTVALRRGSGLPDDAAVAAFPFCGGRSDALDGAGWRDLRPNVNQSATFPELQEVIALTGLTPREFVAVSARLRSPGQMGRMGYFGSWSSDAGVLQTQYFSLLLNDQWLPYTVPSSGVRQYQSSRDAHVFMTEADLQLLWQPEWLALVEEFAVNKAAFLTALGSGWTKLMIADRFDGPVGNACSPGGGGSPAGSSTFWTTEVVAALSAVGAAMFSALLVWGIIHARRNCKRRDRERDAPHIRRSTSWSGSSPRRDGPSAKLLGHSEAVSTL
jgi:catalase-peroxidase